VRSAAVGRRARLLGHRTLAACTTCGHRFAQRWDAERLAAEYRAAYYAHADDPRIARWAQQHREEWASVVRQIRRLHPHAASLLDVGAGSGGFVQVAHELCPAWRTAAVEPAAAARATLRAQLPWLALPVERAEDLAGLPARYDVITILQTLEHLPDPAGVCRAARECLAPGGLLFVTVPNRRAADVLRRGLRADCYENHTHLLFFASGGLRRLLVDAGCERVQRLAGFGGGPRRAWWFVLPQYGARLLGVSTERRLVAFRPRD
jgi:SAM-dependent methyltransferase